MMFFEQRESVKCYNKPYQTDPSFVCVFFVLITWKCKELTGVAF